MVTAKQINIVSLRLLETQAKARKMGLDLVGNLELVEEGTTKHKYHLQKKGS